MAALVVGLGNPGPEYAATRHNLGRLTVEELARRAQVSLSPLKRAHAVAATARLGPPPGEPAVLASPMSYMNLSGGPVAALARYHSIPASDVVVVHDDLDLPFGTVRLKRGGGDGGHNGLKDITKALDTREYLRVRVGIGRPPGRQDAAEHVLRPFSAAERKELPWVLDTAADAVECLVLEGLEPAQQRFHTAS